MSEVIRFGTDGIRGRAGVWPITEAAGEAVGRVAVQLGHRVLVGRDPRPSSEGLAAAVVAGIVAGGGEALDAGVVPTPAIGGALAVGLADVGVMITASHNPAPDNGFKIFGPGGRKLDDAQAAQVEAWLAEPPGAASPGTRRSVHDAVIAAWEVMAREAVGVLPDRKLVVDLAHGAATGVVDALGRLWPGVLVIVGGGDGVVNAGVGSEHLEHLGAAVLAHGADAGLAVDGDGDRCRLVDEAGDAVDGDAVTWLLARGRGVRGLAVTVMSSAGLESQLPGVEVVRTAVGDKHVAAAMRAHGLALGAEESGHVLFDDVPAGDGLIAGLRALAVGFTVAGSLSSAVAPFERWPRRQGKLRVKARPPLDDLPEVRGLIHEQEPLLGESGRIFLRYSGTEPVLRILVEGRDAASVDAVFRETERVLAAVLA